MLAFALLVAFGEAGAGHAFAQTAFPEKVPFEAADLLIEKIICYLDQSHDDIDADGGVWMFDAFSEGFIIGAGLAVEPTQAHGIGMIALPFPEISYSQEIAVIFKQFFEAGSGDIGEFDFRFLGCCRSHAAFYYILLARSGGLDHLVAGTVELIQEAVAEIDRGAIDNLRLLIGKQTGITAMGRDEAARHGALLSKDVRDKRGERN